MKDIDEMTDQEIVQLTDEEIEKMIKIKAMEQGIKLMSRPEKPEYETIPGPKRIFYRIPILYGHLFGSKEDAEAVSAALRKSASLVKADIDWDTCDSPHTYHKYNSDNYDPNDLSVVEVYAYTSDEYEAIFDSLERNKDKRSDYDKKLGEFMDYCDNIADIEDRIVAKVEGTRLWFNNMQKLTNKFAVEYMPCTDGDERKALEYIGKAYELDDDEKRFILDNYRKYLTNDVDNTEAGEKGGDPGTEAALLPQD